MLGERVLEAVFDGWCDGEYGMHPEEGPEVGNAIDSICSLVGTTHEQRIHIEKEVQGVVNLRERNAFEDGFYIGVELMNGNIFKEVQTK